MPEVKHEPGDFGQLKVFFESLEQLDHLTAKIGWFESAKYNEELSVASVAAQNEFGNEDLKIPPRPFMRPAIAQHSREWNDLLKQGALAILAGNETAESVMEKMGLLVAGQIRKNIADVQSPKLSPRTVQGRLKKLNKDHSQTAANAFLADSHTITKPLVFAGIMKNTITYIVDNGQEVMPWETEADYGKYDKDDTP